MKTEAQIIQALTNSYHCNSKLLQSAVTEWQQGFYTGILIGIEKTCITLNLDELERKLSAEREALARKSNI